MKGTEILESTSFVGEIHRLTESSEKLLDEILALFDEIDAPEDSLKQLWLTERRGTFREYIKGKQKYDDIESEEEFLNVYPNETIWLSVSGLRYKDTKFFRINDLTVCIDHVARNYFHEFDYDCDELFSWVMKSIRKVLSEIQNGTYNDFVRRELPYTLRNGTIKRSIYWKEHPEDRDKWIEGLTDEEVQEFLNTAPKYTEEPAEVIKGMTFHKYMEMANACYKRIGLEVYDDLIKTFFSYAEDFGGGVLHNDVDYESEKDFDDYFDGKFGNHGGHPWGILRGSSRTRILLYPERKDGGYYFRLGGNPNWNVKDLVRSFLALRDLGIPFQTFPSETINYLKENDVIGIVSEEHTPIYCDLLFPNITVHDFRHLDIEKDANLLDKIEWLPIEEVKLKQ